MSEPELVERLRHIAPRRIDGRAPPAGAFNMDGICLWELNELINEVADALERLSRSDVTEDDVERWKAKCLFVANERDRLAEHRERLIEELAEARAAIAAMQSGEG